MPKPRRYPLSLSKAELETLQHLIERAAAGASLQQRAQLESIATKVYRRLLPEMVGEPTTPPRQEQRVHL